MCEYTSKWKWMSVTSTPHGVQHGLHTERSSFVELVEQEDLYFYITMWVFRPSSTLTVIEIESAGRIK